MDGEVSCPFKEWDSLSYLLHIIPQKGQRMTSLTLTDITITSIDVCGHLLMVGTNMAVLYIIDRRKRSLIHKLKCGNFNDEITNILTWTDSTDSTAYSFFCGTVSGQVYIHKLKIKQHSESYNVEVLSSHHVELVNRVPVSSLQCSAAMLYVGDESGVISGIDLSKCDVESVLCPVVLLNESQPITQLSLHESLLIVSTISNSIIFNLDTKQISKIGTKPRKMAGYFGGCFNVTPESAVLIFSPRPGMRLWRCNIEGTVLTTHMYKELLSSAASIKLHGETTQDPTAHVTPQFGRVLMVDETTLLSWGNDCLILVDLSDATSSVLLGICRLPNIQNVICDYSSGDIFILGGKFARRLHRLSRNPDKIHSTSTETPQEAEDSSSMADQSGDLPPIVLAGDLKELSLSDDINAGGETGEEEEGTDTKLKQIESKFQSGLSTVKEKLTITGTDVKEATDHFKVGFGNFLTKIQNINNRKSSTAEELSEFDKEEEGETKSETDTISQGEQTQTEDLKKSQANESGNKMSFGGFFSKLQNLAPRKNTITEFPEPSVSTESNTSKSSHPVTGSDPSQEAAAVTENVHTSGGEETTPEEELDDDDLVVRFGPPRQRDEMSGDTHPVSNLNLNMSKRQSQTISTDRTLGDRASYETDSTDNDNALQGRVQEQTHKMDNENEPEIEPAQSDHDQQEPPNSDEEELTAKEENSAEELLSRLHNILDDTLTADSQNSTSYDFLRQSCDPTAEHPAEGDVTDVSEQVPADRNSATSVGSGTALSGVLNRSLSINQELSDSDSDDEDIYRARAAARQKSPSPIPDLSFSTRLETVTSPITKYSLLMYNERWTCEALMSTAISITLTNNYIWVLDKSSVVWISKCTEPGFVWKKLDIKADQISVAPSGSLAWRVYKGVAYAGHCKVPPFTPMYMKWTEAAKSVSSVAVDENCAWYIKKNGEVWLQSNLSRTRPIIYGSQVDCKHEFSKITSRGGVTMAVTKSGRLFSCRVLPNGRYDWVSVNSANNICDICLNNDGSACWVIDSDDTVWYMTCVSNMMSSSESQTAYQVNFYEALSVENRHKFRNIFGASSLSKKSAGAHSLVSVSNDVITVCHSHSHQDINVCRTHAIGYNWLPVSIPVFSSTAKWRSLCSLNRDNILAMYETGEVFCINLETKSSTGLQLPQTRRRDQVIYLTSCSQSVWLLYSDRRTIYYSTDVSNPDSIRLGVKWRQIDMAQLEGEKMAHITVGQQSAWAVTHTGRVFMCLGINRKTDSVMSPAWIEIDSLNINSAGNPIAGMVSRIVARFTMVLVNDINSMVWAVDSDHNVFVRKDVSSDLPVGSSWIHVVGLKARQLCLSDDLVWAITEDDKLMCRVGITSEHIQGECWKQVPGRVISQLTVSGDDRLVGLSTTGQLVTPTYHVIGKVKEIALPSEHVADDDGWQLV